MRFLVEGWVEKSSINVCPRIGLTIQRDAVEADVEPTVAARALGEFTLLDIFSSAVINAPGLWVILAPYSSALYSKFRLIPNCTKVAPRGTNTAASNNATMLPLFCRPLPAPPNIMDHKAMLPMYEITPAIVAATLLMSTSR